MNFAIICYENFYVAHNVCFIVMVPAHFHDVDGYLSDHNVGENIGNCPKF